MRKSRPELVDVLLNTSVEYNDREEGVPSCQHPIFDINSVGETTQIVFNNTQRAIQASLSTVQSRVFYKALKAFHRECYEKENVFNMSIEEGDLLIFNNRRILYGHSAFTHPCKVQVTCYT